MTSELRASVSIYAVAASVAAAGSRRGSRIRAGTPTASLPGGHVAGDDGARRRSWRPSPMSRGATIIVSTPMNAPVADRRRGACASPS